jgi:hypothetical protein
MAQSTRALVEAFAAQNAQLAHFSNLFNVEVVALAAENEALSARVRTLEGEKEGLSEQLLSLAGMATELTKSTDVQAAALRARAEAAEASVGDALQELGRAREAHAALRARAEGAEGALATALASGTEAAAEREGAVGRVKALEAALEEARPTVAVPPTEPPPTEEEEEALTSGPLRRVLLLVSATPAPPPLAATLVPHPPCALLLREEVGGGAGTLFTAHRVSAADTLPAAELAPLVAAVTEGRNALLVLCAPPSSSSFHLASTVAALTSALSASPLALSVLDVEAGGAAVTDALAAAAPGAGPAPVFVWPAGPGASTGGLQVQVADGGQATHVLGRALAARGTGAGEALCPRSHVLAVLSLSHASGYTSRLFVLLPACRAGRAAGAGRGGAGDPLLAAAIVAQDRGVAASHAALLACLHALVSPLPSPGLADLALRQRLQALAGRNGLCAAVSEALTPSSSLLLAVVSDAGLGEGDADAADFYPLAASLHEAVVKGVADAALQPMDAAEAEVAALLGSTSLPLSRPIAGRSTNSKGEARARPQAVVRITIPAGSVQAQRASSRRLSQTRPSPSLADIDAALAAEEAEAARSAPLTLRGSPSPIRQKRRAASPRASSTPVAPVWAAVLPPSPSPPPSPTRDPGPSMAAFLALASTSARPVTVAALDELRADLIGRDLGGNGVLSPTAFAIGMASWAHCTNGAQIAALCAGMGCGGRGGVAYLDACDWLEGVLRHAAAYSQL